MNKFSQELIAEIENFNIVDAHSHLPTEEEELKTPCDIFNRVLNLYSLTNAQSTGFEVDREWLKNPDIPLKERWEKFSPIYNLIKETGYVRAARLSAQGLYGCDINDDTYDYISKKINEQNKVGLFEDILEKRCKIERVINQGSWKNEGISTSIFRKYMGLAEKENSYWVLGALYKKVVDKGFYPTSVADFAETLIVNDVVKEGYKGIKFVATIKNSGFTKEDGERCFARLRGGEISEEDAYVLAELLIDNLIGLCGEHGLVVTVHCGINCNCGGDFYENNPKNLIPFLIKHPNTKFDLYHAAIPWVREVAVIANQFPNVYLNLTWAHQISPFMVINFLNEWLDLVPVNKIIAFGSDSLTVEKVYGALSLTRENIALALEHRSKVTGLSPKNALEYCRLWFYNNPRSLYKL